MPSELNRGEGLSAISDHGTDDSSVEDYQYVPSLKGWSTRQIADRASAALYYLDTEGKETSVGFYHATPEEKREWLRQFRKATGQGAVNFKIRDGGLFDTIKREWSKYERVQSTLNERKQDRDAKRYNYNVAAAMNKTRLVRQQKKRDYLAMQYGRAG